MQYIAPNGDYPRFFGDIKIDDPDWNLGDPLPEGWIEVKEVEAPSVGQEEVLYELEPAQIDGVWTQRWAVRPATEEEKDRIHAYERAVQKLKDAGLDEYEVYEILKRSRGF